MCDVDLQRLGALVVPLCRLGLGRRGGDHELGGSQQGNEGNRVEKHGG
jgi:hypothetical protein